MSKYLYKPDTYSSHSRILRAIVSFAKERKLKILDVGCATGFLARELQKRGHEVIGIEIDKEAAKEAKKYCSKVIVESADSPKIQFPKESFDVIIFGDVLEHLPDPPSVLSRYKHFLKSDGLISISTSNVANWYVRVNLLFGRFEYEEKGIMDKTHLRFYTRKSLKKIIKGAGLHIVDFKGTPIPFPMIWPITAKGKPLHAIHLLYVLAVTIWPTLFAFEWVTLVKKSI